MLILLRDEVIERGARLLGIDLLLFWAVLVALLAAGFAAFARVGASACPPAAPTPPAPPPD